MRSADALDIQTKYRDMHKLTHNILKLVF